jgi:hypothetical protein
MNTTTAPAITHQQHFAAQQRSADETTRSELEARVAASAPIREARLAQVRAVLDVIDLLALKVTLDESHRLAFSEQALLAIESDLRREAAALTAIPRALAARAVQLEGAVVRRPRTFTDRLTESADVVIFARGADAHPEICDWIEPDGKRSTFFARTFLTVIDRSTWDAGLGAAVTKAIGNERARILSDSPRMLSAALDRRVDVACGWVLDGYDLAALVARSQPDMAISTGPSAGTFPARAFVEVLKMVACPRMLHAFAVGTAPSGAPRSSPSEEEGGVVALIARRMKAIALHTPSVEDVGRQEQARPLTPTAWWATHAPPAASSGPRTADGAA